MVSETSKEIDGKERFEMGAVAFVLALERWGI